VAKDVARRALKSIGLRLIEIRTARGLTQEQVAERANVSPRTLQRMEAGASDATITRLITLCTVLDTELPALIAPPSRSTKRHTGRPRRRGPPD